MWKGGHARAGPICQLNEESRPGLGDPAGTLRGPSRLGAASLTSFFTSFPLALALLLLAEAGEPA